MFETPNAYWKVIGEDADLAWEANKKFLENQLESGIDIYFDGNIDAVKDLAGDSTAAREIIFIEENLERFGYEFSKSFNGWAKVTD